MVWERINVTENTHHRLGYCRERHGQQEQVCEERQHRPTPTRHITSNVIGIMNATAAERRRGDHTAAATGED